MAISAAAIKAAIAVLSDEKARGKVAVIVGSVIVALFVPIFLLIALLTLPFGGLGGAMSEAECDALAAMRGPGSISTSMTRTTQAAESTTAASFSRTGRRL